MDVREINKIKSLTEEYAEKYPTRYSDGTPYLPYRVKLLIFREVFPSGSIVVKDVKNDANPSSDGIIAAVEVYESLRTDQLPLARTMARRTSGNVSAEEDTEAISVDIYDAAITAATSKAFSLIGIDLPEKYLHDILSGRNGNVQNAESVPVGEFVPEESVENGGVIEEVPVEPEQPTPTAQTKGNKPEKSKKTKKAKEDTQSNSNENSKALTPDTAKASNKENASNQNNEQVQPKHPIEDEIEVPDASTEEFAVMDNSAMEEPEVCEPEEMDIPPEILDVMSRIDANKSFSEIYNDALEVEYKWRNRSGILGALASGSEADKFFLKWLAKPETVFARSCPLISDYAKILCTKL